MNKPLPPGMTPDALVDLHEAAAAWFARRQEPGWTGADERALEAWLQADPLHRETFASLGRTRQLLGQLGALRGQAAPPQAAPVAPAAAAPRRSLARRPALQAALAVCCALLVGGGWFAWEHTPQLRLQVATAQGETRSVELPDGTRIALNIASRVEVRYYPRRREVVLGAGEAFFQVAPDAGRPFTVDAGPNQEHQVRVVGTAFNLRAGPPRFTVQVREGMVQLRADRTRADAPVLALAAGAGIAIDTATGRQTPVAAEPETVGDWRSGQLRFRRTPLADVAHEVARYLGQPVTLAGPGLAELPVSAFFTTAAPDGFMELLPDLVPVRVQRQPAGGWTISRR